MPNLLVGKEGKGFFKSHFSGKAETAEFRTRVFLIQGQLTDHPEVNEEAPDGLGADLTLVDAFVPHLRVADPQKPFRGLLVVDRLEPVVRGVGVPPGADDVQVVVP